MPSQGPVSETDWTRLLVPVVVLMASVAACSAMRPADAGTPSACRRGPADPWIVRAASAPIAEQARRISGSSSARRVMPDQASPDAHARADQIDLFPDDHALTARTSCG